MAFLKRFTKLSRTLRNQPPAVPAPAAAQRAPYTSATIQQQPMYQNPLENQTLTLPDGRTLGFAEYGDSKGTPLFWFHGTPSSRFEGYDWDKTGKKLNARIISTDRPGFGLSTLQPGRTFMDWPKDVKSLADHLGYDKFHVMGGSGGGPFVVACANYFSRDVLKGSGIVAGVGPYHVPQTGNSFRQRLAFGLRYWTPGLVHWINRKYLAPIANDPEKFRHLFVDKFIESLGENDKKMFKSWPEEDLVRFSEGFREALRPGTDGDAQETQMLVHDWGFKLEDVDANPVRIFWGDEDVSCSKAWQQYQADHIKGATLTVIPGETHFTICERHGERIMGDVLKL